MTYICPVHKTPLQVELVLTGGCCGHSREGDYCYCDFPDVHAKLYCGFVSKRGKSCKYTQKIIPGLTNQSSIERWIQERINT